MYKDEIREIRQELESLKQMIDAIITYVERLIEKERGGDFIPLIEDTKYSLSIIYRMNPIVSHPCKVS